MASTSSAISRQRLREFAENTDTHGFKFLTGSSVGSRILWLLLIISSIGFLSYFFYDRVDYYYQYKSTTNVEYWIDEIVPPRLPPIALCFDVEHMINASKLTVSDIVNSPNSDLGSLGLVRENIVERSADGDIHLKRTAVDFFGRLLLNKSLIYSDEAEQFWVKDDNYFDLELMRRSVRNEDGPQGGILNWKPIINTLAASSKLAVNEQKDYDMNEVVERCGFTAEAFQITPECRNKDYQPAACPRPSRLPIIDGQRCFLLHSPNNATINYLRVEPSNNVVIKRSLISPDRWFTWSVLIHYGSPKADILQIPNNWVAYIFVKKVVSSRRLGPPYSAPCGDLSHMEGNRYITFGEYSAELCIMDCRERCFVEMVAEPKSCQQKCQSERCLSLACEQNLFFTDHKVGNFSFLQDRWEVQIFATRGVERTVYTEVALYPAAALLAELCGTMGLFLGVSLLTVAHCLEFWLREALAGVRHCCRTTTSRCSLRSVVHRDS